MAGNSGRCGLNTSLKGSGWVIKIQNGEAEISYPNPSSATDMLFGVSFHGERREGKKSYIILSDGAEIPNSVNLLNSYLPLR